MPNRLAHETLLLPQPGVYQIRCIANGKIYIGSATNLRERWYRHRRQLRVGRHHNPHLQAAWDKYGEENFEFSVLEQADRSNLLCVEQAWLDRTGCADPARGFNVFDTAGSPGDAFAQVWEGFVDPDGNEVTITNLFEFCRQRSLDFPSIIGFVDPEGRPAPPITNLAAFCREHGLDKTHMVAVAHGRICSHRGWTHVNGKPRQETAKTYTGFMDPQGRRVTITNLQAFCREHDLHAVHMHQLISGQRKYHKGWTWEGNDE